jgi:hypothetical protein
VHRVDLGPGRISFDGGSDLVSLVVVVDCVKERLNSMIFNVLFWLALLTLSEELFTQTVSVEILNEKWVRVKIYHFTIPFWGYLITCT